MVVPLVSTTSSAVHVDEGGELAARAFVGLVASLPSVCTARATLALWLR